MAKSRDTLDTITRQIPQFFEIYTQHSINGRSLCAVDASTVNNRIYSCIVLRLVCAEVLVDGSCSEGWAKKEKTG